MVGLTVGRYPPGNGYISHLRNFGKSSTRFKKCLAMGYVSSQGGNRPLDSFQLFFLFLLFHFIFWLYHSLNRGKWEIETTFGRSLFFASTYMDVSKKWWYPQHGWLIMENPIKMDDLGGKPHFRKHPYSFEVWNLWNSLQDSFVD